MRVGPPVERSFALHLGQVSGVELCHVKRH
jgi:hypothetical protein